MSAIVDRYYFALIGMFLSFSSLYTDEHSRNLSYRRLVDWRIGGKYWFCWRHSQLFFCDGRQRSTDMNVLWLVCFWRSRHCILMVCYRRPSFFSCVLSSIGLLASLLIVMILLSSLLTKLLLSATEILAMYTECLLSSTDITLLWLVCFYRSRHCILMICYCRESSLSCALSSFGRSCHCILMACYRRRIWVCTDWPVFVVLVIVYWWSVLVDRLSCHTCYCHLVYRRFCR